jgi:hypothetical protein
MYLTWQTDLHNSIRIDDYRHEGKTIVENAVNIKSITKSYRRVINTLFVSTKRSIGGHHLPLRPNADEQSDSRFQSLTSKRILHQKS